MFAMSFNGLNAQEELVGDFPCPKPAADHAEDLQLPVAKPAERRILFARARADKLIEQSRRHSLADINLPSEHLADRGHHFFGGFLLHDVSLGAGAKRAL